MTHGVRRSGHIVCFRGQSREASNGFAAHLLVRIGARDVGEHVGVIEARHRRAAHARVGVLARERAERVALLRADLIHRCRTHGGIGVLPARSWSSGSSGCPRSSR